VPIVRIGMRWWLSGVFVAIAIVTAVLIASVSSRQADRDLRANAESIAVGETVSAVAAVDAAIANGDLGRQLVSIGGQHGLALFVFEKDGTLYAQYGLRSVRWQDVPKGPAALAAALHDRRFVQSFNGGNATVVGLPLRRHPKIAALITYAPRPPAVGAANEIFRNEVISAAIWAVLAAAATGLVAASLIARRLRRIAQAAIAIEQGDFRLELQPRFRDEAGQLATTINGMRLRLGDAFDRLSAERNRLVVLLEQLQEGVLAVDRDLKVGFANSNVRSILVGAELEQDEPLPELFEELPLRRFAEGLFEPGAPISEARCHRADGATISVVGVPAGASDLAVLVVTDITERERRRAAEREFVTNASHELRTPVTAITSAVEALKAGAQDEPASRERFIDLIGRQADRLTRLTSSLLVLARAQTLQESMKLEPVELRPLLDEVVAASPPANGVRVRVDCDAPVTAVGRRDVLEQVLSNLVGNAIKHTESGEVVLRARQAGTQTVIEVTDTGPGIPAAAQARVFDRFYRGGRRDGFGLGLAIARDSAEAIGAELTIESSPGRGTVARVSLPGAG
jgi:two-component system, OmpR family, phosphate regulon sensor histidine kinase PhoR